MNDKQLKKITIFSITGFLIWAIMSYFTPEVVLVFDRIFSTVIIGILYVLRKRINLTLGLFITLIGLLLIHNINFYDTTLFGIPFDRIMHFTTTGIIAFAVHNWIGDKNFSITERYILTIFLAFGFASFIEIFEFVGFSLFDAQSGILGYGEGDFGEYNNVSWDMISNLAGALIGTFLSERKKR